MPTETDWEEIDARPSAVGQNHRSGSSRIGNISLQKIWRRAYGIMGRLRGRRERGSDLARAAGRDRFIGLLKIWRDAPSDAPLRRRPSLYCVLYRVAPLR